MPTYTDNYNLPKPGGSEVQDVAVLGEAMDKIDLELKKNADNIGLLQKKGVYYSTSGTELLRKACEQIYGSTSESHLFLVTAIDALDGNKIWIGIPSYLHTAYNSITIIASNILGANWNEFGTIDANGGSGQYRYAVLALG